ncbi:MAG: hypothetical protein SV966_17195 [Actinomycetota bacterium]|nr:hypothetical protein [Actinomycetota bacterium]
MIFLRDSEFATWRRRRRRRGNTGSCNVGFFNTGDYAVGAFTVGIRLAGNPGISIRAYRRGHRRRGSGYHRTAYPRTRNAQTEDDTDDDTAVKRVDKNDNPPDRLLPTGPHPAGDSAVGCGPSIR